MDVKLYVGNLSYTTTEDDLRTLFSQAGTVASVALIKDRDTNRSKGFAFVEMSSQAGQSQSDRECRPASGRAGRVWQSRRRGRLRRSGWR
jgi:hypothetical protein